MSCQRGFTLLETLAAIAVLTMATVIALGAFAQGSRALQQAERADRHTGAARSLMDDFDLGGLEPGRHRGTWQGLDWVLEVSAEPVAAGTVELYRLVLSINDGQRTTHYSTLRARNGQARP
ncbi:type II secretion system protein [Pseudomonas putida]|nr:type II secretion system protein [Pseudomonas putida]